MIYEATLLMKTGALNHEHGFHFKSMVCYLLSLTYMYSIFPKVGVFLDIEIETFLIVGSLVSLNRFWVTTYECSA